MKRFFVEKLGSGGALLAALACPVCFPKLAIVSAILGLGVFAPYEGYIVLGVQALFVLALIGQVVSYRTLKNRWLLGLAIFATTMLFVGYYVVPSSILLQVALGSLVIASVWQVVEIRRCPACSTDQTAP